MMLELIKDIFFYGYLIGLIYSIPALIYTIIVESKKGIPVDWGMFVAMALGSWISVVLLKMMNGDLKFWRED